MRVTNLPLALALALTPTPSLTLTLPLTLPLSLTLREVGAAYEAALAHAASSLGDASSALEIHLDAEQNKTVQAPP